LAVIGNQLLSGSFQSEYFSGDGSTTEYTLTYPHGNEPSVIVSISGVKQKTDSYALIAGKLVFTEAPPAGSNNIEVVYLGNRVLTNPYLSADTYGIIRINPNTISENVTIPTLYNASSAGPLTIANNRTVTVANGATWVII
jgi:hypothetical protein